ncbi:hypothetical protein [Ruegeria sp. 6PALISEP08]|nr:hypothetical protein [Ruegeria sp. 6PALISEP08]
MATELAYLYQPSMSDTRAIAEADVIFINSLGIETGYVAIF